MSNVKSKVLKHARPWVQTWQAMGWPSHDRNSRSESQRFPAFGVPSLRPITELVFPSPSPFQISVPGLNCPIQLWFSSHTQHSLVLTYEVHWASAQVFSSDCDLGPWDSFIWRNTCHQGGLTGPRHGA